MPPRLWPKTFDPFPSDNEAVKAWFDNQDNHRFGEWESAAADAPELWHGLELCIETVTRLKGSELSNLAKGATFPILESLPLAYTVSKDSKELPIIAQAIATSISKTVTTPWKEQSVGWIARAVNVWARRASSLGRKAAHQPSSKAKTNTRCEGPSLESSDPKRVKTSNTPMAPAPQADRSNPDMPRAMGDSSLMASPASLALPRHDFTLLERNIEVRLPPTADHPIDHVTIAIPAIVKDTAQDYMDDTIRSNHLSLEKFMALVRAETTSFDLEQDNLRYHVSELQRDSSVGELIKDEYSFHNAVALLQWEATKSGTGKVLCMTMGKKSGGNP